MRIQASLLFYILFAASSALGQQQAPPNPCEDDARYHQFDFWIGEWEVFSQDGKKQGENSIQPAEGECLLIENWTSATGGTGQSYNYFDVHTGRWNQMWVSQSSLIDISGGLEGEAMVLTGDIVYNATGKHAAFRGSWTPKEDGSVDQFFEQYDPEKKSWNPWFLGNYRKKGED
jgi:hypothetical protein